MTAADQATALARSRSGGRRCWSPHPPPPQPEAVRLEWRTGLHFDRCRVAAWTCAQHMRVWYELCRASGLVFLRRTHHHRRRLVVTYSDAWRERHGLAMWAGVLSGRVR